MENDYQKYRGKCKEMAENVVKENPSFTLVRGHYLCPLWGKQAHWWAVAPDGKIVDPSVKQFPSKGVGDYIPFDGFIDCAECGKRVELDSAMTTGAYAFCSYHCNGKFLGVF